MAKTQNSPRRAKPYNTSTGEFILITPQGIAYTEAKTVEEAKLHFAQAGMDRETFPNTERVPLQVEGSTIITRHKKSPRMGREDYHSIWVNAITGEIYINEQLIRPIEVNTPIFNEEDGVEDHSVDPNAVWRKLNE